MNAAVALDLGQNPKPIKGSSCRALGGLVADAVLVSRNNHRHTIEHDLGVVFDEQGSSVPVIAGHLGLGLANGPVLYSANDIRSIVSLEGESAAFG